MFVIIPSSIRDVIDHITLMRRANRTVDRGVESVPSEDLPWMDPRGQPGGSGDEHASRRQRSEWNPAFGLIHHFPFALICSRVQ